MKLYQITIANYLDDSSYDLLMLSFEPLDKNSSSLARFNDEWVYVHSVKEAKILFNAWDESEHETMTKFIETFK
jgi:hypothetical protein